MNRYLTYLFILLLGASSVRADYIDAVNRGNEALTAGDYKAALENYHIAEADIPESPELSYNMGLALYGQQSYEAATERFTEALDTDEADLGAATLYNLGNVNFQMQDYIGAIENYKKSLELNPADMDAKYNLELARKMLKENSEKQEQDQKEQQQNPEGEGEKDPDGDKSKKDDEGDKQKKDEDGKEQQQDQQGQKGEKSDEEKKDQEGQQLKPDDSKPMSKEDAERILNALKDDEREVQKKLKRAKGNSNYTGKDW